jgi:hypothetical protein
VVVLCEGQGEEGEEISALLSLMVVVILSAVACQWQPARPLSERADVQSQRSDRRPTMLAQDARLLLTKLRPQTNRILLAPKWRPCCGANPSTSTVPRGGSTFRCVVSSLASASLTLFQIYRAEPQLVKLLYGSHIISASTKSVSLLNLAESTDFLKGDAFLWFCVAFVGGVSCLSSLGFLASHSAHSCVFFVSPNFWSALAS